MADVTGTIASAPIARFSGSLAGVANEGRIASTVSGVGTVSGTLGLVILGVVASAPIARFGGSVAGDVFDGQMAANMAGYGVVEGFLDDGSFDVIGTVASRPIARFGGSGEGDVFDGRMGATADGLGTLAGDISYQQWRMAEIPGASIARFRGYAVGLTNDGAVGYIDPAPVAHFGGSAMGRSFAPRSYGIGSGKRHLWLGQISDSAVPTTEAADLYVLTEGYGLAEGDSTLMAVETPDIAPAGELARIRARLISCPLQYDAACTVRVTPIADYMQELDPLIVGLVAPGSVTRRTLQMRVLRAVTVMRLRLEVLECTGNVEFYTPTMFYTVMRSRSGMAMGEEP